MLRWWAVLLYVVGLAAFGWMAWYAFHGKPWGWLWALIAPPFGASVYYQIERRRKDSAYRGRTRTQIVIDVAVMGLVLGLFAMCWAATVRFFDER